MKPVNPYDLKKKELALFAINNLYLQQLIKSF
jgi:hypothetical protein